MGLSIGLDTAVKALRAHQLAVDVASHNIANAQTPGFSRQRVLLRPLGVDGSDHFTRDALLGRAGFGVDARDVNRVRDVFLDYQVRLAMGQKEQFATLSGALSQAELVFNDPTDDGMSALLGQFWAAWQDVVNDPESPAARTTLVHSASTLTARLQLSHADLTNQREDLNLTLSTIADKINSRSSEIAQLNLQIKQVELNGDMANDLRDRRDLLLDELSAVAGISYSEQPDSSVVVYLGSHELVVATDYREVAAIPDTANPGMKKLVFTLDNNDVESTTGELRGLLDARDTALPDLIEKLNTIASGLIGSVNSLHSAGYGLDGVTTGLNFFTGSDASDIALNATLAASPHMIGAAGGPNQPGDGSVALQIANLQLASSVAAGFAANSLVPGETLSAGNALSGLTISPGLSPGQYHIVANGGNLELRYGSPTGALVGTATPVSYLGPGAGTFTMQFTSGPDTVATLRVNAAGPYTAAAQITDLTAANNNIIDVESAPDAFYTNMISVLGADVNRAEGIANSSDLMRSHLEGQRQSVSGVNLDEEITNLNASQHAYQAAARVITVIDEMLDTLINRTGA